MEQAVWAGEEAQRTRASATNSGDLRSISQDPRSRKRGPTPTAVLRPPLMWLKGLKEVVLQNSLVRRLSDEPGQFSRSDEESDPFLTPQVKANPMSMKRAQKWNFQK